MMSQGRRTFLAFLDVSKAYDIVWREGLWMMREYRIQEEFVDVCKSLQQVCCWVENVLDGLKWWQGRDGVVLCYQFSIVYM